MSEHRTFFKTPLSGKVARRQALEKSAREESRQKTIVRGRDRGCRFPMCGCRKFGLRLEVSHRRHKGMGGNPAGDRSKARGMVLLCSARHKENVVSVDRGTLRWRPLSRLGAAGPIAWDVDTRSLEVSAGPARWVEVARELQVGVLEPVTPDQRLILLALRSMER